MIRADIVSPHSHQPFGVVERGGSEHRGPDERIDRRVGADAEGKGRYDDGREERSSAQDTDRVTKVPQIGHGQRDKGHG